jgi:hypothetical protein
MRVAVTLALRTLATFCVPLMPASAQEEPVAVRPIFTPPPPDTIADTLATVPAADRRIPPTCWRAKPRPPCNGFFLTDFGVEVPLRSTRHVDPANGRPRADFSERLIWTFGFMGTKGRHSFGPAISVTSEEFLGVNIIEGRYRNWLGRSAAIDAAVGFKANDVRHAGGDRVRARGVTAMLGFTPNRYIGVSVRGDLVRARERNHRAILVGATSTRFSEIAMKNVVLWTLRTMLGAIGVELEDPDAS